VPRNAGLSSSASLEVATAIALLSLTNAQIAGKDIALLCQAAENEFVGAPCGIMDQFISVHAHEHNAIALDCRYLTYEDVPLPAHLRLVIANSMVKHSVAGGEYAQVRGRVEQGVAILQRQYPDAKIVKLRDVPLDLLNASREAMPDVVFRACRHIITDSQRVLDGCALLREGRIADFGKLLVEAHASYRDDFEASCPECDTLVDAALAIKGCYGSRLTGGGFG
jgi:galactokinase